MFSLDDMEHGILRCNKPHPSTGLCCFKESDPRLKYTMKVLDPRIHFALVCGAKVRWCGLTIIFLFVYPVLPTYTSVYSGEG